MGVPPLAPRLPSAMDSFARKWGPVIPLLPRLRKDVVYPIMEIDLNRARTGQYPVSVNDTVAALQAARSQTAITPPPRQSFMERVFNDVKLIGTSIPKLPGLALQEIRDLPNIPRDIAQGRREGENIVEAIATAPGARLLPGAFVAESVASGQPGRLAEHPVMAALDVLPVANRVSKTVTGQPIGQLMTKQIRDLTPRIPGIGPAIEHARTDLATRRLTARGKSEYARAVERGLVPPPTKLPTPKTPTLQSRALGGAMTAFRTAILPLSPRWHLYNIVGGGILTAARTDPRVLGFLGEARRMVKEDRLPNEISTGMASVPMELANNHLSTGAAVSNALQNAPPQALGLWGGAKRGIDRLYAANEYVDKFYRALAYLHGEKYGMKARGLAPSREAGIKLANTVLQDWDKMTPFERQVMRTIFPFYGWMRHIAHYTATYPFDHPLRASILSSFARNEYNDWASGVPQQFWSVFRLGVPDQFGNVKTVNPAGTNPFSDVSSLLTFGGFFSQLNPALQGLLESRGLDSRTGAALPYPETTFDRQTGRIVTKTRNPVLTTLEGFVPQGRAIADLFGKPTAEFRSLKDTNPEAYRSAFWGSLGVPALAFQRTFNPGKEAARSEISRRQVQRDVFNRALRTGEWSEARKWPQLNPLLDTIQTAYQNNQLQAFERPPTFRFGG